MRSVNGGSGDGGVWLVMRWCWGGRREKMTQWVSQTLSGTQRTSDRLLGSSASAGCIWARACARARLTSQPLNWGDGLRGFVLPPSDRRRELGRGVSRLGQGALHGERAPHLAPSSAIPSFLFININNTL